MTVQDISTIIGYANTYGPVILTFITTVISAASVAAAHLPKGGTSGWWYATRKVIDILAFNYGNAGNKP
jgi:hypothetical protein